MRTVVDPRLLTATAVLVLGTLVVLWKILDRTLRRHPGPRFPRWKSVLGAGTAVAIGVSGPLVPAPVVSVPVSDVIAPAVAVSVLRRILRLRRAQMTAPVSGRPPRRLTTEETSTLAEVVRASRQAPAGDANVAPDDHVLPPEVHRLMQAVEDTDSNAMVSSGECVDDWFLLVRLMGEPTVENRSGERAAFGKKKSMELLSWMVLNRDRSTRSAARTAMWDVDVASSTFSTIVSDLRRGLRNLSSETGDSDLAPTTYTDALPLSRRVTTDVELLEKALASGGIEDIDWALGLVRDMPFAGTSYLWADLDGSTTRIVMTVMRAVSLVVQLATESGDTAAVARAVRAGLRVMPGDENLLSIQQMAVARPTLP